ncbi:hypothetical protein KO566_14100, partial [Flavobacteriaceae bacterium XHP0103]|uniref:methylamine utilization protein MauJ n=1 Tax=Marixanthotalea marina TaxID=2844359 RepID=UPI002989CF89
VRHKTDQKMKPEIKDKLKELDSEIEFNIEKDYIHFYYPKYKMDDLEFDREDSDDETISIIKEFLSYQYSQGKSIYKKDYYEVIVNVSIYSNFWYDENFTLEPSGDLDNKIYYEIGSISDDFGIFLDKTIHWDHFEKEYFVSLKIYNADTILKLENGYSKDIFEKLTNTIFFDLHHKGNYKLNLVDLSDDDKYDFDNYEEPELEEVDDTTVDFSRYDNDLLSYYNRAVNMSDSEFKYLAYFQVLECIFDEVYKFETIEDVRGILQTNWFSSTNDDNIGELIQIVDRYNKEKNDRNKTKLVLEKYFLGALHDEAFFLVNREISELLIDMKLINQNSDIKDLQKLANIVYDFRCNCTHSNRSYPIKESTVISNDNLNQYIELIRKISERIILNYRKSSA